MLRSKAHLLACGMALTSLFALDAAMIPSNTLKHQIERKNPQATKPTNPKNAFRGDIRRLSIKKQQKVYQQMAERAKKNKKAFSAVGTPKNALKSVQEKGLLDKSYFPKPKHQIFERSPNGDVVTIEDGSCWSVKESDQSTARSWLKHAPITFVPNKLSFWSKLLWKSLTHKYRIVNLQTKESVQASLSLGPFVYNEHTKRIQRISKPSCEIVFDDGTIWKCDTSKASRSLFNDWRTGDFVITGVNNTWFGLGQNEIIINVNSDNWITAQRVF